MSKPFFAHSESEGGIKELVIDHLKAVAQLSEQFAAAWNGGLEGKTAGLLHDLGKYTEMFQKVLCGKEFHVDHASPGAFVLLQKYKAMGLASAVAVQGHHDGLVTGVPQTFAGMVDLRKMQGYNQKRFSSDKPECLISLFKADGGEFPDPYTSSYPQRCAEKQYIAAMMYIRMLYSALTDADFIATEAHFSRKMKEYVFRTPGVTLDPEAAQQRLEKYRDTIRSASSADENVNQMRDALYETCLKAGSESQGVFTLTAPTGSGKTLASLAFALKHAATHKLDRVIIVLPYLNIIEQTASEYHKILSPLSDSPYVLEDHSLSSTPDSEQTRLLAENWDSPVIITTTVKFFEGLFGNRSSVCRRLHNIARSVVVFDEAQTVPPRLAVPTLASISELVRNYGCSAVFCTATQPAFEVLANRVKELCGEPWHPTEIVPEGLIAPTRRVQTYWPDIDDRIEWEDVAQLLEVHPRALVIVNLRRHAVKLFNLVKQRRSQGVFHLSTNMCPEHRKHVLAQVKRRLKSPESECILVSTQCIEAGVDVDFPVVFRALAPLEAIIQSAGRCNRNGGLEKGILRVFQPPIETGKREYPDDTYQKAASQVKLMIEKYRNIPGCIDIENPIVIRDYYSQIFSSTAVENQELQQAIEALDFVQTAKEYKWIDQHGINILVPYAPKRDLFEVLCGRAREGNIDRHWITQARMLAVNTSVNQNSRLFGLLEPVITKKRGQKEQTGWYILLQEEGYNEDTGLNPEEVEMDFIA